MKRAVARPLSSCSTTRSCSALSRCLSCSSGKFCTNSACGSVLGLGVGVGSARNEGQVSVGARGQRRLRVGAMAREGDGLSSGRAAVRVLVSPAAPRYPSCAAGTELASRPGSPPRGAARTCACRGSSSRSHSPFAPPPPASPPSPPPPPPRHPSHHQSGHWQLQDGPAPAARGAA
eukprot:scaffold43475_cov41-Phaeocystis_antarctica.AAC.2